MALKIDSVKKLSLAAVLLSVVLSHGEALANEDNRRPSDNSGRQLAVAVPLAPSVNPAPKPALQKTPATERVLSIKGRTIKFVVPKTVDEAADFAWVTSQKLVKAGGQKANEVLKWFAAFLKQMGSAPTMTPAGPPYSYQSAPGKHVAQLYYMQDGRLKTVVKR
ncbi:MAG TPA: hypothetical protein V6D17_20345 [Candidatus Obscuribacterales bacterium]